MAFTANKTWNVEITFGEGKADTYYAFVAEISPEIELLARYYFRVAELKNDHIVIESTEARELKGIRTLGKELEVVLA